MSIDTPYLGPEQAPTRAQLDQGAGQVLVEFGTEWCGHCKAAAPGVKALLAGHPGVVHVRVEDGPGRALGRSFQVKLWPNFVVMCDGVVVRQLARPGHAELAEALGALAAAAGARES